ncbi:MAG: DMT family transporter [Anaerolineae bacterium]|jgi:uncharacterized membrane protein|nr:DMT family transporter [Anaerolineae bacterium]
MFEWAAILFGLLSAVSYGIGDFSGGMSSRRLKVILVLLCSQSVGLIALLIAGIAFGETIPSGTTLLWGAAAGVMGWAGLFALYSALASGQASIAATISGVLSTALPVIFSVITVGWPASHRILGFLIAIIGIIAITLPQRNAPPVDLRVIRLAALSGVCFGLFFILLAQFEQDVVFFPLVMARAASISLMVIVISVRREWHVPARTLWPLLVLTGIMDMAGNAFFVLAEQSGRLDIASVLSSLYPVVTVGLAFMILKERPTRLQLVGIVLILGAIPLIALN